MLNYERTHSERNTQETRKRRTVALLEVEQLRGPNKSVDTSCLLA